MTRSLRIGVVLADRLVEERVFSAGPGGYPITLGQSLKSALSVPVEGVPREHALFVCDHGQFRLRVPRGMRGRIGTSDAMVDVADERELVVERGSRGKLSIGEATILFQEIATPPRVPRPQLPASIRGTFADRIDRRLAVIIGSSLVVHIGLAVWAWTNDVDTNVLGMSPVAQTYHQDIIDVTMPDVVTPTPTEPGVATPVAPRRPIVNPTYTPTRPTVAKPGDAQRLASILTGGDNETGVGGMAPRQPGADLGKQIDDVRDQKLTIGDGSHTSRVDDRARLGTGDDHSLVTDPALTHAQPHHEQPPQGRIIPGEVKPDTRTTLTPALVLERIQTVYMVGLQRCYRLGLATDSKLGGRVAISFTVDDRGKVIEPDATGVSSQVDSCIESQMSNWRFPIPKDNAGDATDASFAVSLALQPS